MANASMTTASMTTAQKVQAIRKGLRRLGRNRIAAMPVHTTLDLIDRLEALAAELERELSKGR